MSYEFIVLDSSSSTKTVCIAPFIEIKLILSELTILGNNTFVRIFVLIESSDLLGRGAQRVAPVAPVH